jgi:hypothetical protein
MAMFLFEKSLMGAGRQRSCFQQRNDAALIGATDRQAKSTVAKTQGTFDPRPNRDGQRNIRERLSLVSLLANVGRRKRKCASHQRRVATAQSRRASSNLTWRSKDCAPA